VHHFGLRPSANARRQTVKPTREWLTLIGIFEELSPGHEGSCDAVRRYSKVLSINGDKAGLARPPNGARISTAVRRFELEKIRHKLATEPARSKKRGEENRGLQRIVVCGEFDPTQLLSFRIPKLSL